MSIKITVFSLKSCFHAHALTVRSYATAKTPDRRVFKIYRYGGILEKKSPKMQSYEIDINSCGRMILDVLMKIKEIDPTLTFRKSCREGICGSCAICLQGHNCLACTTVVPKAKKVTIHPIPHMYVQRDLVVDMTHFFDQYNSIRPYLMTDPKLSKGKHQLVQSIADNNKVISLYECVLCACCSTSCPSYWWNGRRFLGPASLLHAYRWVTDSRDTDAPRRLKELSDDYKAFRCHTIMNCTLACPKGLNPGFAIAKLKRLISGLDKKPPPDLEPLKFGSGVNSCINK